jgi:hypothetical protein
MKFARGVGESMDWWLMGLDDASPTIGNHPRTLENAMELRGGGRSAREATCFMVNALIGDIILLREESVRCDVLAYMRQPEIADALMNARASECVMLLDTLDSSQAATQALLTPETRLAMQATIIERVKIVPLSADAKHLYAGIQHLWERAIVAVNLERDNKELRDLTGRLLNECVYALEGDSAEGRREKHLANALEKLMNLPTTSTEGNSL